MAALSQSEFTADELAVADAILELKTRPPEGLLPRWGGKRSRSIPADPAPIVAGPEASTGDDGAILKRMRLIPADAALIAADPESGKGDGAAISNPKNPLSFPPIGVNQSSSPPPAAPPLPLPPPTAKVIKKLDKKLEHKKMVNEQKQMIAETKRDLQQSVAEAQRIYKTLMDDNIQLKQLFHAQQQWKQDLAQQPSSSQSQPLGLFLVGPTQSAGPHCPRQLLDLNMQPEEGEEPTPAPAPPPPPHQPAEARVLMQQHQQRAAQCAEARRRRRAALQIRGHPPKIQGVKQSVI